MPRTLRRAQAALPLLLTSAACGAEAWPPPDAGWRARFAAEVAEIVGPPAPARLDLVGEAVEGADGVRVQAVALENVDAATYPGWLLRPPAARAGPHPGVLLVHGHNGPARGWVDGVDATERALGAALARAGFVVLAPDVRSFGGHAAPGGAPHDDYAAALRDEGEVFVRLAARDLGGALAALRGHSDVDPTRVGVLGQSLGGVLALLVALTDDEVEALVVSGILMPFDQLFSRRNHFCQHLTALSDVGDMPALVAAVSPTAAQVHFGGADEAFVTRYQGRAAALEAVDRWWADPEGVAPEIAVSAGLGHAVDPDLHLPFFRRHLRAP